MLVNMAMTADGKIATANRAISSFGSRRDHDHLLELRATADAVMAGARTVDSANISLGPGPSRYRRMRRRRGLAEFNLRVIVSGSGTVNPRSPIFSLSPGEAEGEGRGEEKRSRRISPVIILTTHRTGRRRLERLRALADEVVICGMKEVDFRKALRRLRNKWGVKRLLCEGGGELNDALFRAGLVDELHLTLCPNIFGGRNAPTIADGAGIGRLAEALRLSLRSCKQIGDELFLCFGSAQK